MSVEARTAPAALVLEKAERRNAELGHYNLGPLSHAYGFVTPEPPPHDLPGPHHAWIEAADELPELCRTLTVRRRLEELPLLDASADSLDDRWLLRAASVIGLLTQAYNNVPTKPPGDLPEQLVRPWLQIAERLGRPALTLNTNDYIWYNWRLLDPDAPNPLRVENLELLTKIWDHPQTATFMLVTFEMLAQSAPLVGCVARAQEAYLAGEDDAVKVELAAMCDCVRRLSHESLPKINTNTRAGRKRVDPVVWTKLFAMLPLPVHGAEGVRNASGVETPAFHLMDVFLGRREYATQLGHEAQLFRDAYPPNWREFLLAVAEESVADGVRERGDAEAQGLLQELVEVYQGRHGLLARHRLKAFAYMDAAFKTGRSATVTGFSGMFEDRAWEKVDQSFEDSRLERQLSTPSIPRFARVEQIDEVCPGIRRVLLDVRGLGMYCEPGDRLSVLPENDPELVGRTLEALRATGDELVDLTKEWMVALPQRAGRTRTTQAPLRDVLTFGHIRPVPRAGAKVLHRLTHDEKLRDILEARTEDQWELWDLLELMARGGFAPQRLWRAERGDYETICRVVPPLQPRLYSVSSVEVAGVAAEHIELTVGQLRYDSVDSPTTVPRRREGTASTYLCRTLDSHPDAQIPVQVVRPAGFALPEDPEVPIVMFAGGTGIAPFRGFLQRRAAIPGTVNILLGGARDASTMPYREELERYAARGEAEVHLAYSRDPVAPRRIDTLVREEPMRGRLRELLRPGGDGTPRALVYVCGRATFSRTVLDVLAEILDEPGRPGREALFGMVADGRYMQDVFTTYNGSTAESRRRIDASELAHRTTPGEAMWQAINGRVYDLTEFSEIHPGGQRMIHSFSGMDATSSYRIVEHHRDPEVEAMLSMFEIGVIRRRDFGARWSIAVGEHGLEHLPLDELFKRWVRALHSVVEIANAHAMEVSIRDEPLNTAEAGAGAPALTPYRLQFGIEAHSRFLRQTMPIVCRRFAGLWRTTSGPCSASAHVRTLDDAVEEIIAGPAARVAAEEVAELERRLAADGASAELADRVAELTRADAGYLTAAKTLLATGVRTFETHQADVLEEGGDELLTTLMSVARLSTDHLDALTVRHAA